MIVARNIGRVIVGTGGRILERGLKKRFKQSRAQLKVWLQAASGGRGHFGARGDAATLAEIKNIARYTGKAR